MGSCFWALGTCCLNCTKFTPTRFFCFPQIALQGSNLGGGSRGQRGPRGRQQRLPDKSCQEASTGAKQCLAGFRGPVSLPSKYPALEGPAQGLCFGAVAPHLGCAQGPPHLAYLLSWSPLLCPVSSQKARRPAFPDLLPPSLSAPETHLLVSAWIMQRPPRDRDSLEPPI